MNGTRICYKPATGCCFPGQGPGSWRRPIGAWLVFLLVLHAPVAAGFAQISREYQLKAVLLWRLAQFTQWPSDAFASPESPIAICVLGENPFGDAIDAAAYGETAQGRPLVVQRHRSIDQTKMCHILFISAPVARQVKELTAALAGRSILTVTDAEATGPSYTGMVQFMTEQNKIKLVINLKAVTAARLVLDSRLLRVADVVGDT